VKISCKEDIHICRTNFAKQMERNLHETTSQGKIYGKWLFSKDLEVRDVLAKHGVPEPKFKGFMADSAQANWNGWSTGVEMEQFQWRTRKEHIYSTRHNRWRNIPRPTSGQTSKINIGFCVSNTRMQLHLLSLRLNILPLGHDGSHPGPWWYKA
jgi:hypothetical protein